MSVSAALGHGMVEAMAAWGRAGSEAGLGGTTRGPNEHEPPPLESPSCLGAATTPSASALGAGPPRVERGDPRHNLNQRRVRWGPMAPAAEPAAAASAAAAAMPPPLRQRSEARPTPAPASLADPVTAAIPPPPRSLLLLLASTSELRQSARNALGSGCLAELVRPRHAPCPLTRAFIPRFTRASAHAPSHSLNTRLRPPLSHTPLTHTADTAPYRHASTSARCAPAPRC